MMFGGGANRRSVGALWLESRLILESSCWFFLLFLLSVVGGGAVVVAVVISPSPHCTSLDFLYLDWRHALPPPGLPDIYALNILVGIVHPPVTFQKKTRFKKILTTFVSQNKFIVKIYLTVNLTP